MIRPRQNSSQIGYKLVLFAVNPFLAALDSLRTIRDRQSVWILYLWFLMFGIAFCAVNPDLDSSRYMEEFIRDKDISWENYSFMLEEYFTFDSIYKDIYTPTVNYIVSRFTDNYHWAFFVYAIVFGFFYVKSLLIFLRHSKVKNTIVFFMLLFLFCLSNPIFNINGVRFWTAAWIGVYVALSVFVEKRYLPLLLLPITQFIHNAFLIWMVVILVAYCLRKFQSLVIVLFVLSSVVSAVSFLDILWDNVDMLPEFLQRQVSAYTESEESVKKMSGQLAAQVPLYARILDALPAYFNLLMCYLLIFNRKKINKDKFAAGLLTAVLAMAATTNFLSSIPSVGRFTYMVIPILVVVWSMNYKYIKQYDKWFYLVPFIYSYKIWYILRYTLSVTELELYTYPAPLTAYYYLF